MVTFENSQWRSALPILLCGILGAAESGAAKNDPAPPPAFARVLCFGVDKPSVYKAVKGGLLETQEEKAEENPPGLVYLKRGKEYVAVPLSKNALSPFFQVQAGESLPGEAGFFLKVPAPVEPKSGDGAGKAAKDDWALFQKVPVGSPYQLICWFNPTLSGAWAPPKSLVVDVSPQRYPAGSLLVVNLCSKSCMVQVGAGTPRTLKSGEHCICPARANLDGAVSLKMAVARPEGWGVLANTSKVIPADSRRLLVIHAAHPGLRRRTEDFSIFNFDFALPAPVSPAPKSGSGR